MCRGEASQAAATFCDPAMTLLRTHLLELVTTLDVVWLITEVALELFCACAGRLTRAGCHPLLSRSLGVSIVISERVIASATAESSVLDVCFQKGCEEITCECASIHLAAAVVSSFMPTFSG